MARYRFALRPKWILSHIFVLVMVVAFINLGFWQLSRLQEKRDRNARVEARTARPVADATGLAKPGDYEGATNLEFRRATVTGTYVAGQEVIVRSRSRNSTPGSWVLTPLKATDGTTVIVNRGWIPNNGEHLSVPKQYAPPSGTVTVTGLVRETETRGSFGPKDPTTGTLHNLARADIARYDQQLPERVLPFFLQLQEQEPAVEPSDPRPVPAPELDEGPHLSYAIQWFTFATMALIFYPLILRRRAREIEREEAEAALDRPDPTDEPLPGDPRLDGGTAVPGPDGAGDAEAPTPATDDPPA